TGPDASTLLFLGRRGMSLGVLTPGLAAAVRLLTARPCTEDDLHLAVLADDGEAALLKLPVLLRRLRVGGWLGTAVEVGGRPTLTLRPL
ncbi:hypothetical protein, partial [Streptomyces sp. SID3343]|uniref:hypothetical protein n=1 Tax=Streptomyces sp. SID3343 TaxID=2690260 RepID=UPI00136B70E4